MGTSFATPKDSVKEKLALSKQPCKIAPVAAMLAADSRAVSSVSMTELDLARAVRYHEHGTTA